MITKTKNNNHILLRRLEPGDLDKLVDYLDQLSPETKQRFGPHPFDKQAIIDFYKVPGVHIGYVVQDIQTTKLIAYAIIKIGYLQHDAPRLQSYGLVINNQSDCTLAPSVADAWQSMGIGNSLLQYILLDLKSMNIKRMILWGGVQASNSRAVNYYLKNGFSKLGQFRYNGENYDMALDIPS